MSEMIERVARALWLAGASCANKEAVWEGLADFDREPYLSGARAAIEAMREPNSAQVSACMEWAKECGREFEPIVIGYQRMIAAALKG